jgi:hypothetical protein
MKKIAFFVSFAFLVSSAVMAQTNNCVAGVYKTVEDYGHQNPACPVVKISGSNKIKLYSMFGEGKILVVSNGQKTTFLKKDIYGYRDGGIDFRLVNGVAYQIIDTADFTIYSLTKEIKMDKGHTIQQKQYFFATSNIGSLQLLDQENLETAFSSKPRFRQLMHAYFKADNELMAFDKHSKKLELKELFEESDNKMAQN